MSPSDFSIERLNRQEARKLIAKIVSKTPHRVRFTGHAVRELMDDGLTETDGWNVLSSPDAKIHHEGEFEKGSFRYRLETTNLMVVVAFTADGTSLVVVTAWDKRKGRKGR